MLLILFGSLLEAIGGKFKIRKWKDCAGSNQDQDGWKVTCLSEWICIIFHVWRALLSCYLYTLFDFDRFLSHCNCVWGWPRHSGLNPLSLHDSSLTVPVLIDFSYLFSVSGYIFRFTSNCISRQGYQHTIALLETSNRFSSSFGFSFMSPIL